MKNKLPREHIDIADGFRALHKTAGVEWKLKPHADLDALACLTVQGRRLEVGVEFKRHIRRSMMGRLHEQLEFGHGVHGIPVILCTEYIDANLAMALKDVDIQFLDKAGNAYLNMQGVFIYVQGNPKPEGVRAKEKGGRAFQSAGLRLVFELLRASQLADRPYRELADKAGISLFAVKCAMDDLEAKGYLQKAGKKRHLKQGKRLLDEWCVAYRDRLRKELLRGTYQAGKADWWKEVNIRELPACWGGEVAATGMKLMRNPQVFTVYCRGNINQLIATGRLHRQDAGDVEILDAFWGDEMETTAPDLIVYADLITSGIERNIETARELYVQRIADKLA